MSYEQSKTNLLHNSEQRCASQLSTYASCSPKLPGDIFNWKCSHSVTQSAIIETAAMFNLNIPDKHNSYTLLSTLHIIPGEKY